MVELRVRPGDGWEAVGAQAAAIGARAQAVLEELEVGRLLLAFPAAREQEPGAHVIDLPAVERRRDLDPHRRAAAALLELGEQRRVEIALHGGVAVGARAVADRP